MNDVTPEVPEPSRARDWKRHPWRALPTWGKWVVGVIGVLFILGIGAAIGDGEGNEGTLKEELASTEAKLADAEDRQEEAKEEAAAVMARKSQIIGKAKSRAGQIIGKANGELSSVNSKLDEQRGELESTEGQLSETQSELSGAEEEAELSVIPGDGTYKVGTDILPGTYRTSGGSGCYWAILNSTDSNDIATNELANGPQIAEIEGAYFQTSGCGEWERSE